MSASPSAAARPGAALVKWTWYTSVAADGFVWAYDGAAATTPTNTTDQRMIDLISPPPFERSEHQARSGVALIACSERRERR
jgi:hypothetical protein